MGKDSRIEWTDHTWNPWMGCDKVSPGCANCYMFREQRRWGREPSVVKRCSDVTFTKPLRWEGPAFVFVCSWSDFFHVDADEWREEAWEIIRRKDDLVFQILTKRPDRIKKNLPKEGWPEDFPHVWLGVSVENQDMVSRIDQLLQTEASVMFVSAEPLLGSLNIDEYLPSLDWVIAGGESGPDCRPMKRGWVRELRDHCKYFEVPFFLKQLGGHPNKRSGRLAVLDGEVHQEMPNILSL